MWNTIRTLDTCGSRNYLKLSGKWTFVFPLGLQELTDALVQDIGWNEGVHGELGLCQGIVDEYILLLQHNIITFSWVIERTHAPGKLHVISCEI